MALLDKLKIGGTVYDAWSTKAQVGDPSDADTATTVFGRLKKIIDFLTGIVTTNPYAKDSTVAKDATVAKEATTAKEEHLNWLNQFFNITNATTFTAATDVEVLNELEAVWKSVNSQCAPEVSIPGYTRLHDMINDVTTFAVESNNIEIG